MGRLHVEIIQIDPVLLRRTADGAVLTPEILADYAARLRAQGRREDSVRSCERVLRQFYDFLSAALGSELGGVVGQNLRCQHRTVCRPAEQRRVDLNCLNV